MAGGGHALSNNESMFWKCTINTLSQYQASTTRAKVIVLYDMLDSVQKQPTLLISP